MLAVQRYVKLSLVPRPRNPIWNLTNEKFKLLVEGSSSIEEIKENSRQKGGSAYRAIKKRMTEDGVQCLKPRPPSYRRYELRSKIWTSSNEDFKKLFETFVSIQEILSHLGLNPNGGGHHRTIRKRMERDGLDYVKFAKRARVIGRERSGKPRGKSLEEVMVKGSSTPTGSLKSRLIKKGILKENCAECGLGNTWNGSKLVLTLDHINGVSNDHRLKNIRILCPNCHSQTETFAGRNTKYGKEKNHRLKKGKDSCKDCGTNIHPKGIRCSSCHFKSIAVPPKICPDCSAPVSKSGLRCRTCSVAQTRTKREASKVRKKCLICKSEISRSATHCHPCAIKISRGELTSKAA